MFGNRAPEHPYHSHDRLIEIAKKRRPIMSRGKPFDPATVKKTWCGACGAALTVEGLFHYPDCYADDKDVRFESY